MLSIHDLNKKIDFNLPDNYFEKMQSEVFTKIHQYEKRLTQRKIFYSISSIAASFLLILGIAYFFSNENSDNLASLASGKKEIHSINNSVDNQDSTDIESHTEISKKRTSVKQMIAEIELDNLDYNIIEYYEESIYDLALLDLYY